MADGVLIRWQGKGTFVQSQKVENALLTVSGFTDFGVSQGKATKEKVIEQERVSAAPFCEKLNIHWQQRSVPSLPGDVSR